MTVKCPLKDQKKHARKWHQGYGKRIEKNFGIYVVTTKGASHHVIYSTAVTFRRDQSKMFFLKSVAFFCLTYLFPNGNVIYRIHGLKLRDRAYMYVGQKY